MTATDAPVRSPAVAAIVRRTIRQLPSHTKGGIAILFIAWIAIQAGQIWDQQAQAGPYGLAELSSKGLGIAGLMLTALLEVLRRAEEPVVPVSVLPGLHAPAATPETLALRQILLALPTVGVLTGALLSAALTMSLALVWIGSSTGLLFLAAVYAAALASVVQVVGQAARRLYDYGQRESDRVVRAEARLTEARLAALQAQMNPHFLFNALNTVAALVRTDPEAAEKTTENLAVVLRTSLERGDRTTGTLADEIEFVRAYLAVEHERLGDRLTVEWHVDPTALDVRLPPLLLQPLVENALKHGIGSRRAGGRIAITASRHPGRLRLEVTDDGEGFPERVTEGTGLGNLRTRLEVVYGSSATLSIHSAATGSRVILDLPDDGTNDHDARTDR